MRFKSGKHDGKTYEEVLLKQPDFAQWYMQKYPDTGVSKEFKRLISKFGAKPFTVKCYLCKNLASRASTYSNNPDLMFFCDDHEPHQSGASKAKVQAVTRLEEVLQHIDWTADGHRGWKRRIVRGLAEGKGLPKRLGEKQAFGLHPVPQTPS
jgi:hypothetical protein